MRREVIQHSVVFSLTPVDPSLPLSPHCLRPPLWRVLWWSVWERTHERVLSPSLWLVSSLICCNITLWKVVHTPTDPPTPPLNSRVSSTLNQPSSSDITLEWDSPSSTGGVSVSYVLTIAPTPLSGSPVTVETTFAQITISYNTPYNVTIRAANCAGKSQETSIVDLSKPFHWECRHRLYLASHETHVLVPYHTFKSMQWCAPHHLLLLV